MQSHKQTITLTIIATTTIATTYFLSKSIYKYGLNGTIRLIWEGDHLPPEIREAVDILDDIGKKLKKNQKKLENVEIMVEVEKLNSVDVVNGSHCSGGSNVGDDGNNNDGINNTGSKTAGTSTSSSDTRIITICPSASLSKQLSMLSYTLDKLAADTDSVKSYNDTHVKSRKREYSAAIVKMMEKVDGFLKECGIDS
jgi:hypothetical protein